VLLFLAQFVSLQVQPMITPPCKPSVKTSSESSSESTDSTVEYFDMPASNPERRTQSKDLTMDITQGSG